MVSSREKSYLAENLALLISSGTGVLAALSAISDETKSRGLKKILQSIQGEIEGGSPLWRALQNSKIFPGHVISLVKIGEQSGKLTDTLKLLAVQSEKDRVLQSKIFSALMYPAFVISLTVAVGLGVAWFVLPRLAVVFSQLSIKLPLITKWLIWFGQLLADRGVIVVPVTLGVLIILIYLLFIFPWTKRAGQWLALHTPGTSRLIKETELARFGYILGSLLQAGVRITEALDSLAAATSLRPYQRLYSHLLDQVGEGKSLADSLASFPHVNRFMPAAIRQLVASAEQSGHLSDILLKVGENFEAKTETTAKNLTVILEPILLVIVAGGVFAVALAVILPIYGLVGGLNGDQSAAPPEPSPIVEVVATSTPLVESAATSTPMVRILDAGFDYLNVRSQPAADGEIIAKALPGEEYKLMSDAGDWYEIVLSADQSGWVSKKYVELVNN